MCIRDSIYSGGLGNVAGDQLKAASDLGVPVVGVGLLYQQGYFRQEIDKNGAQQALYPYNDPGQLPITPLRHPNGEWLRLEIALPGYSVWLRTWQVQVGRLKLYLLDSNDAAKDVYKRQDQESEMIGCLEAGADDYLTKPVSSGQVVARVRAVLRRTFDDMRCEAFIAGHLRVEFDRREVFVAGGQIRLTATEYHLLVVMVRHAGRVRTHRQLVHEVWGSTQYQDAVHLLRVTVSNLRRKLASDSGHDLPIVTEPGVGYRLRADSSHASSASFAQAT